MSFESRQPVDVNDLPPLPVGADGPVLNPPTADEVLEGMRLRYQEARERAGRSLVILPPPARTTVAEEIEAIEAAAKALAALDEPAAARVATWLFDRFVPRVPEDD